jgi:hypothetical protein
METNYIIRPFSIQMAEFDERNIIISFTLPCHLPIIFYHVCARNH